MSEVAEVQKTRDVAGEAQVQAAGDVEGARCGKRGILKVFIRNGQVI